MVDGDEEAPNSVASTSASDDNAAEADPQPSEDEADEPAATPEPAEPAAQPTQESEPATASDPTSESTEAATPDVEPKQSGGEFGEQPADQVTFVEAAVAAQVAARTAENDLKLGAAKAEREEAFSDILPTLEVQGWQGEVVELDANGDGLGIVTIRIAEGVEVGTWNNFISDMGDDTLIDPSTEVFKNAMELSEGDIVEFSGVFVGGSGGDTIRESSLTLRGGIESPSFIFRFSAIEAVGQ